MVMAKAIDDLLESPRPSQAYVAGLLDGLDTIVEASGAWLTRRSIVDVPHPRYGEVVV